jgi:hypothetical protein
MSRSTTYIRRRAADGRENDGVRPRQVVLVESAASYCAACSIQYAQRGDAIASGVKAIMTGPSPIDAVDPGEPASTSEVIVHKLRADLSFSGLIISDDVDLRGTLRGRMVPEVAVKALKPESSCCCWPAARRSKMLSPGSSRRSRPASCRRRPSRSLPPRSRPNWPKLLLRKGPPEGSARARGVRTRETLVGRQYWGSELPT